MRRYEVTSGNSLVCDFLFFIQFCFINNDDGDGNTGGKVVTTDGEDNTTDYVNFGGFFVRPHVVFERFGANFWKRLLLMITWCE